MELRELGLQEIEWARKWRNQDIDGLRTPFLLTREMQERFYREIICNRNSPNRYWSIWDKEQTRDTCVGIGGLTNIQWENGVAEISLIIDPEKRNQNYGEKAVGLLLKEAFNRLRLVMIYGECYLCNPIAVTFWSKITDKHKGEKTKLSNRKFVDGRFWDSLYFCITK